MFIPDSFHVITRIGQQIGSRISSLYSNLYVKYNRKSLRNLILIHISSQVSMFHLFTLIILVITTYMRTCRTAHKKKTDFFDWMHEMFGQKTILLLTWIYRQFSVYLLSDKSLKNLLLLKPIIFGPKNGNSIFNSHKT